ncbi:MAG: hypothetical protein Q4F49_10115 [Pseudoxanthomonas suwonensis]|nr:hypothetical protein [Pseudoxanthomonas suwonensis]
MTVLPRSSTLRLPLCLLLLSIGPLAMAQEGRATTTPGNETPERSTSEAEDESRADNGTPQRRVRASGNRSPEEANGQRVPRWHSYLPGMFR